MFSIFVNEIENQFNKKVMRFRTDRVTEHDYSLFNEFYKQHGIIQETTTSYSPEMNGNTERKNKIVTGLVVAIMLNSGDASHSWGKFYLLFYMSLIEFCK